MLHNLKIDNFKSIRSLALDDCRRINLLIGRPNVGKSNILEAMSLFDIPYLVGTSSKSLRQLVRVANGAELFYNGLTACPISVRAGADRLEVSRQASGALTVEVDVREVADKFAFNPSLTLTTRKEPAVLPSIMTYFFEKNVVSESSALGCLLPPFGSNLMQTVAALPELKTRIAELFHGYGLKMMFDAGSQQIKAMRENGLDMFLIPFESLADSMQRLIFYKAAIHSNTDKTICLEEPEAHTFPPYITNIVDDIVASRSNQFFITTHSPYVVGTLLEQCEDELAIYVIDMVDNQTTVTRLTDEQMQEIYDNGLDLFYNIETFIGR